MHVRHLRIAIVAAALSGFSTPAHAVCTWKGLPCSTFWSYDAVFEGTVVSIEQKPADPLDPPHLRTAYRLVTFNVHRSWRGDPAPRVQLRSPGGLNVWIEDAMDFAANRRYLVFARRQAEVAALTTSKCDPTVVMSSKDALSTLAFLDTLDKPSTGGRISGHVEAVRAGGGREPLDVTVVLQSANGDRRTVRTTRGQYSFEGVPPGRYTVTVEPAAGAAAESGEATAIEDPHQCRWVSLYLRR